MPEIRKLTLKDEDQLDTFLHNETINYGFADYLSEKSRLEDVLQRHLEDIEESHEGDAYNVCDAELIEIQYTACYVLAIINRYNVVLEDWFEGNFDDEEIEEDEEE